MYRIARSKRFERSFRKLEKSGKLSDATRGDLILVFDLLAAGRVLPMSFWDHRLKGEFQAYRECHIKGDLLLVYQPDTGDGIITVQDIGTHSYLFG